MMPVLACLPVRNNIIVVMRRCAVHTLWLRLIMVGSLGVTPTTADPEVGDSISGLHGHVTPLDQLPVAYLDLLMA